MNNITKSITLLLLCLLVSAISGLDLYVDSSSKYQSTSSCGSIGNACQTITDALAVLRTGSVVGSPNKIILTGPSYKGFLNRGIPLSYLTSPLSIESKLSLTVIDCDSVSNGFTIVNSSVTFKNLGFTNCIGTYGGAIATYNSNITFINAMFIRNKADIGGAIYSEGSKMIWNNCTVNSNTATNNGNGLYLSKSSASFTSSSVFCNDGNTRDIVLVGSTVLFRKSDVSQASFSCDGQSDAQSASSSFTTITSFCPNKLSTCPTTFQMNSLVPLNVSTSAVVTPKCNNNGNCDGDYENCLNCPKDCKSCQFVGTKFTLYSNCALNNLTYSLNDSCIVPGYPMSLPSFNIPNIYTTSRSIGTIKGYFKLKTPQVYTIKVSGENLGVEISLDNRLVMNSNFIRSNFSTSYTHQFRSTHVHSLNITIFTPFKESYGSLSVSFTSESSNEDSLFPFYSQNICNDGILDVNETDICGTNEVGLQDTVSCGDGVCNEVPEKCLSDCYQFVGYSCPSQVEPISNNLKQLDTLSHLLNNQFMFSVPGLSHMAHGINLITGEELPTPIFDFGYCDNTTFDTIQDLFRQNVYTIPPEYFVEFAPSCAYDTITESFSNSYEYQSSVMTSTEVDESFGGDVKTWGITANYAFSGSESVNTMNQVTGSKSGTTTSIKVNCIVSSVTRNSNRFHKNFVRDIANVRTPVDMVKLIQKYGVFYYKSTSLGGSLQVMVFMDESMSSNTNEKEIQTKSKISAAIAFSSSFGKAGAKYQGSEDSEVKSSDQSSFQFSTTTSSVMVKGGVAGSFGPDISSPSSFGTWAQTVDLKPVPINPKLDFIGNIIPESWVSVEGKSLKELWYQGYNIYVTSLGSQANLEMESIILYLNIKPESNRTALNATEVEWFKNITVTFINYMDDKTFSFNITNPSVRCVNSCQSKYTIPLLPGDWEISGVILSYYNAQGEFLTLDTQKYFDQLIVYWHSTQYTRGYIFNPRLAPKNFTTISESITSVQVEIHNVTIPEGTPPIVTQTDDIINKVYTTNITTLSSYDDIDLNVTIVTTNVTLIKIETLNVDLSPLPPSYDNPDQLRLFFTTRANGARANELFFPIVVGETAINTMELVTKSGTAVSNSNYFATYEINDTFNVGNIESYKTQYPSGISNAGDVFAMWQCPTNQTSPEFQFCVDDGLNSQTNFGYIKMIKA